MVLKPSKRCDVPRPRPDGDVCWGSHGLSPPGLAAKAADIGGRFWCDIRAKRARRTGFVHIPQLGQLRPTASGTMRESSYRGWTDFLTLSDPRVAPIMLLEY